MVRDVPLPVELAAPHQSHLLTSLSSRRLSSSSSGLPAQADARYIRTARHTSRTSRVCASAALHAARRHLSEAKRTDEIGPPSPTHAALCSRRSRRNRRAIIRAHASPSTSRCTIARGGSGQSSVRCTYRLSCDRFVMHPFESCRSASPERPSSRASLLRFAQQSCM